MKKSFFPCLIILILALLLTGCADTSPQETLPPQDAPPPAHWQPTLTVQIVSPTGATVLFRQEQDLGEYLLLSGNDYRLQQYAGGAWQELPMLVSEVNWAEAAFVLTAIPREEIGWQWLYGELSPGHYRIGKNVTLHYRGENLDSATIYAEFTIEDPNAVSAPQVTQETEQSAVFQPGPLYTYEPLDSLPKDYSHRQAAADNVVILSNGTGVENRDIWLSFVYRTSMGETGSVRCLHYNTADSSQSVYDIIYDGVFYTMHWFEGGEEKNLSFKHLLHVKGDPYSDTNAADRYILTMDKNVTWDDIQWGMVSDNPNDAIAHKVVYLERSYHPSHPPIPESSCVSMALRGKELLRAEDETAQALAALFSAAEALEQRPQMYYRGLDLIFRGDDGSTVTLWLDLYGDRFLYDGTYYQYSTEAMFDLFGITDWPEEIVFPAAQEPG